MGESSGDQPKVRGDSARRALRRWEDKALVAMMTLLIGVVCFMWKAQASQIDKLEDARAENATKIAVQHSEISALKATLARIEDKLDEALRGKHQ